MWYSCSINSYVSTYCLKRDQVCLQRCVKFEGSFSRLMFFLSQKTVYLCTQRIWNSYLVSLYQSINQSIDRSIFIFREKRKEKSKSEKRYVFLSILIMLNLNYFLFLTIYARNSYRKSCLLFLSMETTADPRITMVSLDKASFQLHKIIFLLFSPLLTMHFHHQITKAFQRCS